MGDGRHRNEPCWCGSGEKFKLCHLGRESQAPLTPAELIARQKAISRDRTCLHPKAGADCRGKPVRAHSVQRSGGLSRIALNGHVLTLKHHDPLLPSANSRNAELPVPQKVGIQSASTFTGFCNHHDSTTFAPLERQPFAGTKQQVFLLGYRALCSEVFAPRGEQSYLALAREVDRGLPLETQRRVQDEFSDYCAGVAAKRSWSAHDKAAHDQILLVQDFARVGGYIVRLDCAPTVMCTGVFLPEYDFTARQLQDLTSSTCLDSISFSLIATHDGGAGVFSWIEPNLPAARLVETLNAMPEMDVPNALVRLAFEHLENTYFSPVWWQSLEPERKWAVRRRAQSGLVMSPRKASCLVDDGHHLVPWKVTERRRLA